MMLSQLVSRVARSSTEQQFFLFLAFLGIVQLVRGVLQLVRAIWIVFLRPGKDLTAYGSWALVTGATDGIGKSFAMQLARRGLNVVVVGRTESKLQDVVRELEEVKIQQHGGDKTHSITAKYVVVDFAGDKVEDGMERLSEAIQGLDVGIVINNVGVSYAYAKFLHEVDKELVSSLVEVNIMATTRVSQLVLPGMIKQRKGAIVNIGSGSGSILPADPLYAIYAASKSYIEVLSRAMYLEYKHVGIDVQCQAPLLVKTKLAKVRRTSLTVPSPDTYVESALRSIGYEPLTSPYWSHHLLWSLISLVPERLFHLIRLKSNLDLRKRGMAKETRETKAI